MKGIASSVAGAQTVLRRRGPHYARYFASGVLWPRAAYRYLWGPDANAAARALVYGAVVFGTSSGVGEGARGTVIGSETGGGHPDAEHVAAAAERLLDDAHARGVTGLRYRLQELASAAAAGRPWRIAQDARLRRHARRGIFFAADRDADRVAFNHFFGTQILTEASVRAGLRTLQARVPPGYRDYAPIDFGGGLHIGQVAATDSGTGRWEFFNRRIVAPLVAGRRVLDLGSNNGSLPLMMARAGAASIVGLEATPAIAEFARFNARVLAWRDIRPYDIRIELGDMRRMLTGEFGAFDVVTAFCSLYYVPEEDMARIIAASAAMGATMILQANEAIGNLPARAADLRRLLAGNGYSNVAVHTYPGFARPLLVGTNNGVPPPP